MGQVLHGSARTTEAVRRAVQRSEESVRALAKRHGISPTTVQKWRKSSFVADLPMGPIEVRSTVLSVEEEAMIVAKVEWHPGELYPRFRFIVTNMARRAENVVAFYTKRGTYEQWIKEGKGAIKWTRISCRSYAANAVRL